MKIRLIILIFLINISVALAQIDINILRENYSALETLQAEITLDNPIKELSSNDITIDNTKIAPFIFSLDKNKYFVYLDIPKLEPKSYNLNVQSRFVINNILTDITQQKEFNLVDSDVSLAIKPAILILNKNDIKTFYKITLKNNADKLGELNVNVNITSDFLYPARNIISLEKGEERNLFIFSKQGNIKDTKIILSYDRVYEIPIIVKSEVIIGEEPPIKTEEVQKKASFITEQPFLIRTLNRDEAVSGPLEFRNNLNRSLKVEFYLTDNLNEVIRINLTSITLKPNEINYQYIWINEKKNAKGPYSGSLVLEAEDYKEEFPIELSFIEKEVIPEEFEEETEEDETQEDLGPIKEDFTPEVDIGLINLSEEQIPQPVKERYILFPIMLIVIITFLLLVIFYLLRIRKPPKTFKEYVSKVGR